MTVEAIVEDVQALRIGPDERLILRFSEELENLDGFMADLSAALKLIGLEDRALVISTAADMLEFVVVEK